MVGSLTGEVASQSVTEASKGRFRFVFLLIEERNGI